MCIFYLYLFIHDDWYLFYDIGLFYVYPFVWFVEKVINTKITDHKEKLIMRRYKVQHDNSTWSHFNLSDMLNAIRNVATANKEIYIPFFIPPSPAWQNNLSVQTNPISTQTLCYWHKGISYRAYLPNSFSQSLPHCDFAAAHCHPLLVQVLGSFPLPQ